MSKMMSNILENRDDYPLTNVRWRYGILLFLVPMIVVGLVEKDMFMLTWGPPIGVGFLVFMSVSTYAMENYKTSRPARITLAFISAVLLTLILAIGYTLITVFIGILSPLISLGILTLGIFVAILYFLSE